MTADRNRTIDSLADSNVSLITINESTNQSNRNTFADIITMIVYFRKHTYTYIQSLVACHLTNNSRDWLCSWWCLLTVNRYLPHIVFSLSVTTSLQKKTTCTCVYRAERINDDEFVINEK